MDNNRIKAVLDLKEFLDTIGEDRPPVGVFFKALNLNPQTVSDCVTQHTMACQVAIPQAAVLLINDLFKLGITIGYKYAVKKYMEQSFDMEGDEDAKPN